MTDNSEFLRKLFADPDEEDQPATDPKPLQQPLAGPVIPGQANTPEYTNKTGTSRFLNQLFNN